MNSKLSSPSMKVLWYVTAGVAVLLLIITLILVVKVQGVDTDSFTGTINDHSPTVYLRNQPDETGSIIAILDPGTEVYIDRSSTRGNTTWYHVRTDSGRGWIQETDLSLSRP